MIASVSEVVERLAPLVAGLGVETPLSPEDGAELVELFVRVEHLAAAGRVLATQAVAEGAQWRREGYRSPGAWMAAKAGMPVGPANDSLKMAEQLDWLPGVDAAFRAGRLSEAAAREIAAAASEAPEMEQRLLDLAEKAGSLRELREECERITSAALDEEERQRRANRERHLRAWRDRTGAGRITISTTAEGQAHLMARVDARTDELIAEAKQGGWFESAEAHRVDALMELVCNSDPPSGDEQAKLQAVINVIVDYEALVRGHTHPGEKCEVPGLGPIPVSAVRRLDEDPILKVLVTKGVDIMSVAHAGRVHIPAHLESALEVRDPCCIVPGCNVYRGLDKDHTVPVEDSGWTMYTNLGRLCGYHHRQKTKHGYTYRGGPGNWEWIAPDIPDWPPNHSP